MGLHTFDFKDVSVVIGGSPIHGFAEGEAIQIELTEDSYTMVSGADGIVTRVKSNNRTGALTLTLTQSSLSNDVLTGYYLQDLQSNSGVVSVEVRDNNGTSEIFSATGWIRKPASMSFGKDATDREWILDLADVNYFVGGNTQIIG